MEIRKNFLYKNLQYGVTGWLSGLVLSAVKAPGLGVKISTLGCVCLEFACSTSAWWVFFGYSGFPTVHKYALYADWHFQIARSVSLGEYVCECVFYICRLPKVRVFSTITSPTAVTVVVKS